jgi:hypothetical protein
MRPASFNAVSVFSCTLKVRYVSFLALRGEIGSFPIDPLGQVFDCSGRSPAIRSNAMSNSPAQPPPTNATTNHQAEVTADSLLNELSVAHIRFDRMRYFEHVHITPEVGR